MALTVRCLATVATTLLLAVGTPTQAYTVRAGDIYELPEVDRTSAKQLYARDADIVSTKFPYIKLDLFLPGRVYIRHVVNETAVASGVVGRVRLSGDRRDGLKHIKLPTPGEHPDEDADDTLAISSEYVSGDGSDLASVLIDIELYTKHSLRAVASSGTADIVILEDLLSPSTDAKNGDDDTRLESKPLLSNMMPGKIFVSDPKAEFSTHGFSVFTKGPSTVQLDVASLKSTERSVLWFAVAPESNVTLFASEFVSPILVEVALGENETLARNPLCVSTKDDVKFKYGAEDDRDNARESVVSGGSACTKLPLPPREPAVIGELSIDKEFVAIEANMPTFAPAVGASSKTSTPTSSPVSSAIWLASSPVLTVLISFLLLWW